MGELTKIAAILFKNLSDALLSTASELSLLDSASPLSQTSQKQELVSIIAPMPKKMFAYRPREKVIVKRQSANSSIKMTILKKVSDLEYLAYHSGGLKRDALEIAYEEILGLDPDR